MDIKRLFQLLVVSGTVIGVGESCGGNVENANPGQQTNTVTRTLPDGGTVTGVPQDDGGIDTGGGVDFW